MDRFRYKAINSSGKQVKNVISAVSREAAIEAIEAQGLYPIDVNATGFSSQIGSNNRISSEKLLKVAKQLMILTRTGLNFRQILEIIGQSQRDKNLKKLMVVVEREIGSGRDIRSSFETAFGQVDPMFYAALSAGEASGQLSQSLESFIFTAERRQIIRTKIRKAAIYPIFLLILVMVVLAIVFQFVLPRFTELYADFGSELPSSTRILLKISDGFPYLLAFIAFIFVSAWLSLRLIRKNNKMLLGLHRILFSIPIIGQYLRLIAQFEFLSMIELMFNAGTPVYRSLLFAAENASNLFFGSELRKLADLVEKGESVDAAIEKMGSIDFETKYMISVGERSGTLNEMLKEARMETNEKLDRRANALIELIEPVFLVVVGGVIGFIVIAIYMPMLNVSEVIN